MDKGRTQSFDKDDLLAQLNRPGFPGGSYV